MATFSQSYEKCEIHPFHGQNGACFLFQGILHGPLRIPLLLCVLLAISAPAEAQRPLGTDVSGYQTSINWTSVKNAGVAFAWAKATEGTYYTSSYFPGQESGAKSVGIYMGAYHYAAPSTDTNITGTASADTEAQFFWNAAGNYIKAGGAYCVPMLDWEDPHATNGYVNSGGYTLSGFTTSYMSQWVNEWCLAVSNHAAAAGVVGVRPVVYTGTWYSTAHSGAGQFPGLNSTVTTWPNWMSDYNGDNAQTGSPAGYTYPWSSWNIWQYDNTNWSGGDADVYNGSLSSFVQTFVIGGTNGPIFTQNPSSLTTTVGSNITFSARASGTAPLGFHWYCNGKIIPGATSSNYSIANVLLTNAGSYYITASNSYANIQSSPAYLWVLNLMTNASGSAVAPANLVNWWTGDSNSIDIYGNNNAIPYNNVYYVSGECGQAFHFDGSSTYLIPSTTTTLSPNWTLCLWVNRQNAPGVSAALMGDSTYAIKLEQYNTTREVGITQSGVADYLFSPAYTVPIGTWTHLAFVGTSTTVTLYANGGSKGTVSASNFPLPRGCIGGDLIGSNPVTDPMLGSLDEIQIFNRALSATEIANIYNAGAAGLVRAPQFNAALSPNSTQVQLQLRGITGKNISLYTSTNLTTWTLLGTVSNLTGTTTYTGSNTNGQQFYRAFQ